MARLHWLIILPDTVLYEKAASCGNVNQLKSRDTSRAQFHVIVILILSQHARSIDVGLTFSFYHCIHTL